MREQYTWTRLGTHMVLDRTPWLRVFVDEVKLPDGRVIEDYLRVESRDFTMICAVTESGQTHSIREFKYGVGRVDLQLPAGFVESGEALESCARRELLEETGFVADYWTYLGSFFKDGNWGFGRGHFFLAQQARRARDAAPGDLSTIEVELIDVDRVEQEFASGRTHQMAPIACLALAMAKLRH